MRRVRILLPVVILALGILALVELSGGRGVSAQSPVAADPAAVFSAAAEQALEAMAKEATARQMKGVAVIAFVPGDATRSWASQMRVVDAFVLGQANVLGIAYAKMSEMADTLENSGSGKRPPHHGELGSKGGRSGRCPAATCSLPLAAAKTPTTSTSPTSAWTCSRLRRRSSRALGRAVASCPPVNQYARLDSNQRTRFPLRWPSWPGTARPADRISLISRR